MVADSVNDTITINGVNQYTLPVANSTTLGGVKSGTDITIDASGNVSVNNNSHTHTKSNITDFAHSHTASEVTDFDAEVANNTDVSANTSARHTHSNKATLDTYNQTNANLTDAVSKKHEHSNKTVIDSITQALIDTWNTVTGKADKSYVDTELDKKANTIHEHVKSDVGLGNVDNTSDINNPIKAAQKQH